MISDHVRVGCIHLFECGAHLEYTVRVLDLSPASIDAFGELVFGDCDEGHYTIRGKRDPRRPRGRRRAAGRLSAHAENEHDRRSTRVLDRGRAMDCTAPFVARPAMAL
jgi:hypothetical protein